MKPDDKLCYCFHVSQRKVVNFIRIRRPRVPSQISECGGAGTGCGWCVPFLKSLFDAVNSETEPKIEMSAESYAKDRSVYVRSGKGKPPASAEPLVPEGPG
jgi:bacterioferritin-associated ferredoxin